MHLIKCNYYASHFYGNSHKNFALITLNITMPKSLKPHYQRSWWLIGVKLTKGYLQEAWSHLERAHILGQPYPYQHSEVHWLMLQFGFRIKEWKEIRGQLLCLGVGGIKSFVAGLPLVLIVFSFIDVSSVQTFQNY